MFTCISKFKIFGQKGRINIKPMNYDENIPNLHGLYAVSYNYVHLKIIYKLKRRACIIGLCLHSISSDE